MALLELTNGRVWVDEQGDGEPLVLVHGGAVDGRFFAQNVGELSKHFRVLRVDLWGHGRSPDRDGPFSLDSFATDVAEVIERLAGGSAHVLGHSIGATVALQLALRRPDVVRQLIVMSGGYDISAEEAPPMSIDDMVAGTVQFLGKTYGEVSPDGEEHFAVVTRKDFELSSREPRIPRADLAALTMRTLIVAADDDITPLDHQLDFYRALPNAELAIVPGTSHFFLQEKPALANAIVVDFLTNDPVPNVAPVRRATARTPA